MIKHIRFVTAAVLITAFSLVFVSSFSYGVESQSDEVVIRGKSGAYNVDLDGDPPWIWYEGGDLPPIMAAGEYGDGAVVAAGTVCSCRNGRWNDEANPNPYLDSLFDAAFQWMVPGAEKVLWYEGYSVYNNTERCSEMVSALEELGYTVSGDSTQPITLNYLSSYDILIIPQFELGDSGTGGDPSLLPDADVEAIRSYIEGGGGLLIMDGADFGGYNYYKVHNKILRALDFGFGFQDDQIYDNDTPWGQAYEIFAEVDNGTEIGAAFEEATGETSVGLYAVCSLAQVGPGIGVSIKPEYQAGDPGATIDYTVTITNPESPSGENLTFSLAAEDKKGWNLALEEDNVTVSLGENRTVGLSVTIPSSAEHCTKDNIRVTATSSDTGISGSDNCVAHAVTAEVSSVDVSISPSEGTSAPGTVLKYTVTVANTGTVEDNYDLTVDDSTGWSLDISPSTLAVAPGTSGTATLSVVIPVKAENCTRDNISVTVTSTENSKVENSASCTAHAFGVPPMREVQVSISPQSKSGAPGEVLTYHAEIRNAGESGDEFYLNISNTEGWDSNLSVNSFWMYGADRSWERGVLISIEVPENAEAGDSSTATLTVSGTGYENQATCTAEVSTELPWAFKELLELLFQSVFQ